MKDVQSRNTIYRLAKTMLGSDTNHKLTPGICTRVALMVFSDFCRFAASESLIWSAAPGVFMCFRQRVLGRS